MSIKIPMHTFVARQISAFNRLEGEIQEAQSQISLGKTITHASDDPAAASRIWQFESETENLQRYKRGYDIAEIDLSLQSSALQKVSIGLIRAKELALQANSGILNKNDLEVLATEVKELRGGLFDMANLRNSRDQYLFAGVKGDTRPFQEKNGVISFHGDTEKSMTEVMGGRRIVTADSGSEIFMSVPSKNGGRSLFSIFDELESGLMGNHDVDQFRNPQKFPRQKYTTSST
jgi:flagellar hook-associated protein 3 FlgL